MVNRVEWLWHLSDSFVKPGSHLPPSYLRHDSDIWLPVTIPRFRYEYRSRRQQPRSCQSLPPACLRSWHEFDFAGMPAVKTCDVSWAGAVMSSYVGVVSQAVPAAYENQVLYMFLRTWWCTTFTKSAAVIVFLSFWSFTPIKTSRQKQRIGAPSWSSQPLFL